MAKTLGLNATDLEEKVTTQTRSTARKPFDKKQVVPINFKMSPDFVRRFKRAALERDMKLNALFEMCVEDFINRDGK